MANNTDQLQAMMAQGQKMMTKMQKATAEIQNTWTQMQQSMAQMYNQNYINHSRLAQYSQAIGGMYDSIAKVEQLMSQFYSVQNPVAGQKTP